jgi:hypothetical protein
MKINFVSLAEALAEMQKGIRMALTAVGKSNPSRSGSGSVNVFNPSGNSPAPPATSRLASANYSANYSAHVAQQTAIKRHVAYYYGDLAAYYARLSGLYGTK